MRGIGMAPPGPGTAGQEATRYITKRRASRAALGSSRLYFVPPPVGVSVIRFQVSAVAGWILMLAQGLG